jgi:hypothetical protein
MQMKMESETKQNTTTLKTLNISMQNPTIIGKIHYKCNLKNTKWGQLGQMILYDTEGTSANVICFNDDTIQKHYNTLLEGDIISITNALYRKPNENYTLCDAKVDILLGNATSVEKLSNTENMTFPIPFSPTTINAINELTSQNDIIDCVAAIEGVPVLTCTQINGEY